MAQLRRSMPTELVRINRAVALNGLRWANNAIVEINANNVAPVDREAADRLRLAIQYLAEAAEIIRNNDRQQTPPHNHTTEA
jgi:hypothetical protein